jgi:hypothetical protein
MITDARSVNIVSHTYPEPAGGRFNGLVRIIYGLELGD